MCYDLKLNLLPWRCFESTTHVTPKKVMKFIRYEFLSVLRKMFSKNLSKNFEGELISEQIKKAVKINRKQNEEINEDALLVSKKNIKTMIYLL